MSRIEGKGKHHFVRKKKGQSFPKTIYSGFGFGQKNIPELESGSEEFHGIEWRFINLSADRGSEEGNVGQEFLW